MTRILIIDDDPDVVEACTMVLSREGYEMDSAFDRATGMKKVLSFKPDLLILDVMMEQPDDGIAMAQELRRNNFNAPILMLTSIGKITGLTYGRDNEMVPVDAFEEKPLDPRILSSVVRKLLHK